MSTVVPVHQYTCSVYFFFFGITCTVTFQLIYWGMYAEIYQEINLAVYLHASLRQRPYLSPQLLLYLLIDAPISIHFDYFIPTNHLYLPVLSPVVLSIRRFTINQPVPFVCVFHVALHAQFLLISVNSSAGLHTDRPTQNFDASGYNHEDLLIQLSTCLHAPIQKNLFIFMHPFWITSTIYLSTQLLLYIYTDIPGNKSTSLSWCFTSS